MDDQNNINYPNPSDPINLSSKNAREMVGCIPKAPDFNKIKRALAEYRKKKHLQS